MSSTSGVARYSRIVLLAASVVMLGLSAAVFVASSAGAQVTIPQPSSSPCDPYTKHCEPIVKPTLLFQNPDRVKEAFITTPPPSLPPSPPPRCRDCMPFTGADVTLFAATGFAAIGTGTVLMRATRNRKARS